MKHPPWLQKIILNVYLRWHWLRTIYDIFFSFKLRQLLDKKSAWCDDYWSEVRPWTISLRKKNSFSSPYFSLNNLNKNLVSFLFLKYGQMLAWFFLYEDTWISLVNIFHIHISLISKAEVVFQDNFEKFLQFSSYEISIFFLSFRG